MNGSNQRLALVQEMTRNLFSLHQNLILLKKQIEDESKIVFQKVYSDKLQDLIQDQTKFEENTKEVHRLNTNAIISINTWHEWSNNPSNKSRIFYPLQYQSKKKNIKIIISGINQEIIERTIENRLIKEKISSWEIEVKRLAETTLKESDIYKDYCNLLTEKDSLIQDITYLLSTMPKINAIEIDLADAQGMDHLFDQF